MSCDRAGGWLLARDLDGSTSALRATLIGQMLLIQQSQTFQVFVRFKYLVPINFLKVYFLDSILAVRMVPYDGLQSARIDTVHLPNDPNILVLVLILRYDHV